jgi:hypothetical protein
MRRDFDMHASPEILARLAAEQREHRRRQIRTLLVLAVAITLGLGGIVYALNELARTQPAKVVIDPAKLPPIRPGPAR